MKPDLPELFSHAIDDGELHADVLIPGDGDAPADPDEAMADFARSVKTMLRAGDSDGQVADVIEQAFGFRPTPEMMAAFKAKHGIE